MVLHGDEAGNWHCHAMIVPIDERGHLNAQRFVNGSRALSRLQDDYARHMEPMNLARGLRGSTARHQDIRKFYSEINDKMIVADPHPGESAIEFRERILEDYQKAQAASLKREKDAMIKMRRGFDEEREQERDAMELELKSISHSVDKEIERYEKKVQELSSDIQSLELEKQRLQLELRHLLRDLDDRKSETKKKVAFYDHFRNSIEVLQETDPDLARQLLETMQKAEESVSREYEADIEVPETEHAPDIDDTLGLDEWDDLGSSR